MESVYLLQTRAGANLTAQASWLSRYVWPRWADPDISHLLEVLVGITWKSRDTCHVVNRVYPNVVSLGGM